MILEGRRAVAMLGCALLAASCAGAGTRVEIAAPGLVHTISVVGLAPIIVDAPTRATCGRADSVALSALMEEIERSGAFTVVGADSLLAHVDPDSALDAAAILGSAQRLGLDAVLFCKIEAYQLAVTTTETSGWAFSLDKDEPAIVLEEEPVTKVNWVGAKATLEIAEPIGGQVVISTTFDTFKGKSYWSAAPPERQVADAVEGAFRPVAESWKR